ncbi:MAG: tRNA (guanosine(46)-N7)-methyltransferase TrmB [Clostridia bacterium]
MRLRKKKHLDERLNLSHSCLLLQEGEDFYIKTEEEKKHYFDFNQIFGNSNPIFLELGCGKGGFAIEMARRLPDINFVAVEKLSNVIVSACENAQNSKLTNVKFLNCDVYNLLYYFLPDTIERIYLNFSCPFPKNSYSNRRLTNSNFLEIYRQILKKNGEIHQKTDNAKFFEFSLEQFSMANYGLKNITLDLHHSQYDCGVMTEYESHFVALGKPIYRLEAYKKD